MRRYVGRLVGLLIGALAGPVGAAFGFLAGWLVDQFRRTLGPGWRLERFLSEPQREPRGDYVALWGTAAILVEVLCADGPPRVVQVEQALREAWPQSGRSRRRGTAIPRRSVIDSCLRHQSRINRTGILEQLRQWDTHEKAQLIQLLVTVACADSEGMSFAERAVIRAVAAELSVPVPPWNGLDRNACTILGVSVDADEVTVRRVFRTLAAQMHPDTAGNLDPEQRQTMEEAFVRIRYAHDRLLAQIRERE